MAKIPSRETRRKASKQVDLRKALFNSGKVGTAKQIQVSVERIAKLRGIVFDIDPQLYRKGALIRRVPIDPRQFYQSVLRRWLANHPLLRDAEVRITGTGLHVILNFAKPIRFKAEADRLKWAAIVKVIQAALPIDPNQPGITATTRALGSVNSKNGRKAVRLKEGKPVAVEDVLALFDAMQSAPFKTVLQILTGSEKVSPCPSCGNEDSTLTGLDFVGRCYHCGNLKLAGLWDLVFRPQPKSR